MAWAAIGAAAVGVVGSALTKPKNKGGGSAEAADPFASQRPQYQGQLHNLMNGEFSPTDPSYSFRFNQGLDGLNRTLSSQGQLSSGNQMAAITDYGQNMASTEYANQYARLAQLSGANVGSPAAAGQILYGQEQQQQAGMTAALGSIGNAAGGAFSNWMNPPASVSHPADMTGFQTQPSSSGFFSAGAGTAANSYTPLPSTNAGLSTSWWAA